MNLVSPCGKGGCRCGWPLAPLENGSTGAEKVTKEMVAVKIKAVKKKLSKTTLHKTMLYKAQQKGKIKYTNEVHTYNSVAFPLLL